MDESYSACQWEKKLAKHSNSRHALERRSRPEDDILDQEHDCGSVVAGSLEATEEHLDDERMWLEDTPSIGPTTVDVFLTRRTVCNWVGEWILITERLG